MNALKKLEPTAYAALRIVFGFLFTCHGATKIFGVLGGHKPHDVLSWTGAGIELDWWSAHYYRTINPLGWFHLQR
jgi:uncharacterized membrane protein YphA (DoxX/SURF4 family)